MPRLFTNYYAALAVGGIDGPALDDRYLSAAVVHPSGDATGAADDAAIAAAIAELVASGGGELHFATGKFHVATTIDLTADDELYSIAVTGEGMGGNPDDATPHGSQIVMVANNKAILKVRGGQSARDLCLIYDTQQTTSNTASIALSMHNLNGATIDSVKVWNAHISFGLPQVDSFGSGYTVAFNSNFDNLYSQSASQTHYDFRNYLGGGTNCHFGKLYLNGGGSLDFVTPGQSAEYGIRITSGGGYEFTAISIDGMIVNERLVDVPAGSNIISIETLRFEAVDWNKDADGMIGLGGTDTYADIRSIELKNVKWTPSSPTAGYILRTNATRNNVTVGQIKIHSDCAFGAGATRRVLLNGTADTTSQIRIGSFYDAAATLSDRSWTDPITTLILPVREWDGKLVNEVMQPGKSTNSARRFAANAVPTTGTFANGDIIDLLIIVEGLPVQYRCVTAGTPGTWRPSAQSVKKNTTGNRPAPAAYDFGVLYLDTTLDADGKPIWWNGTAWVDATGATV